MKKTYLALIFIFTYAILGVLNGTSQNKIQNSSSLNEAEILWDSYNVPHIYAESTATLGYGFGWAQMKNYGNDILKLYGLARGQGAEFWGEDYLASDKLMHQTGIPKTSIDILDQQSPEFKAYLEAFTEGMNDYARRYPQQIDLNVSKVLPVQTEDLIRHSQRLFFTFVSLTGNSKPLLGLNGLPTGTKIGSNTIAIGPSRSKSGNAMLLQNPHLPWNIPFMRFFEVQLTGPELDLYGTTLIGLPVIVIGFNEQLGWSHTVNTIDLFDTYLLTLKENGYKYDDKILRFKKFDEIIKVQNQDGSITNDTLQIRHSIHGPIVQANDSSAIAIRTPILKNKGTLQQFWDMGKAKNFEQFKTAISSLQLPMFTITYADRDGQIYYLFNGQIPKRPYGNFDLWQKPISGGSSKTLWTEIHEFEELPSILNPKSGFVQNSNSPPWFATIPSPLKPKNHPEYMAPEGLYLREQRGLEMLTEDESISFEELLKIRYSNRVMLADRVLDDLLIAANKSTDSLTRAASKVLQEWDRHTNADSRGALLFSYWANKSCLGEFTDLCGFAQPWNSTKPISTPYGLADSDTAAALLGKVARQVQEKFGRLDVPWGEIMHLSDDLPGLGAPGDPMGVYHVMNYRPSENGSFKPVHGDSWVAVIEFTKVGPKAKVLMSYGNSSNLSEDLYQEQLKLISNQQMRDVWNTRQLVEENLKSITKLQYDTSLSR